MRHPYVLSLVYLLFIIYLSEVTSCPPVHKLAVHTIWTLYYKSIILYMYYISYLKKAHENTDSNLQKCMKINIRFLIWCFKYWEVQMVRMYFIPNGKGCRVSEQ